MPGIDYLNQPYDPRENNYFNSGLLQVGVEMGGLQGGSWLLNKYAKRSIAMQSKKILGAGTVAPRTSWVAKDGPLAGLAGPRSGGWDAATKASLSQAREKFRSTTALSKTLGRYSKIFGFTGLAIMGYQIGKGVASGSRAFAVGADDIEQARRTGIYTGGDEYYDSRAAFTQRQRALQVIHNSQMSTRAAFAEEASYLHY